MHSPASRELYHPESLDVRALECIHSSATSSTSFHDADRSEETKPKTRTRAGPPGRSSRPTRRPMKALGDREVWFVTGSQDLYGPAVLRLANEHAQVIAAALDAATAIPVRVVIKPVVTSPESIQELCQAATVAPACVGVIAWMHTFSPARMWIAGLIALQKPLLHLHTQYNSDLPWSEIDMDFMNLNQSAHGDREFGFIGSRMRLKRKVVVGFWQ